MEAVTKAFQTRKAWVAANRERVRESERRWRGKNPQRYLFLTRRSHALRKGVEFTVTFEQIEWPTHCPVLGIPLRYEVGVAGIKHGKFNSASLDRFDPSKGYLDGNVRVISWRANRLKADGAVAEFEALIRYMKQG